MKNKLVTICVFVLLVIFIGVSLIGEGNESFTFDEPFHFREGVNHLLYHSFSADPYSPPLIQELVALPCVLLGKCHGSNVTTPENLTGARLVVIGFGAILLTSIFLVTKRFFTAESAILALILAAFEPNLLANSHYATLDIGFSLAFFWLYLSWYLCLERASPTNFFWLAVSLGLALSTKISAIPFFLMSALALLIWQKRKNTFSWLWRRKLPLLFVILGGLSVLWGTYFFQTEVIIAARPDPGRVSSTILAGDNSFLKQIVLFGQRQKIPLGNYMAKVKNTIIASQQGGSVFFWGNFSSRARWYYLPVNFLSKTPITLLVLVFLAFLVKQSTTVRRRQILFMIPVIAIMVLFSLTPFETRIRYILPLYPFLLIVGSSTLAWFTRKKRRLLLLAGLILWYLIGTLVQFPHFLSYANELAGPRALRYLKFYDSNLDWGQSLPDLVTYGQRQKIGKFNMSYFGTDDSARYGLVSDIPYGSGQIKENCAFRKIIFNSLLVKEVTVISSSNWYYCGYYLKPEFRSEKVKTVVGDSLLVLEEL